MREGLFRLFTPSADLRLSEILLNLVIAALVGLLVYFAYFITHRGTLYSKKFNSSTVALTILTAMVITVVRNNTALSLGILGALCIVRFRTAIKDVRDILFTLWAVAAGFCCGSGEYFFAAVGSFILLTVFLVYGTVKNSNRMLLLIKTKPNSVIAVEGVIYQIFRHKAKLKVKNETKTSIELVYEVPLKKVFKEFDKGNNITDALYDAGTVEYANLVTQAEEVSN